MIRRAVLALLRGYKKWISPHLGDNCRFIPTCSEYAMQAVEIHGVVKGGLLSLWRILRCNPLGSYGYDPVPKKGCWRSDERKLTKSR